MKTNKNENEDIRKGMAIGGFLVKLVIDTAEE